MFFLGLLSTPLPYLLLAAFYFFGFAMGVFNNKTGDEPQKQVASVTIPAEIKEAKADQPAFYYQVSNNHQDKISSEQIIDSTSVGFSPDTGPTAYFSHYGPGTYDFNFFSSLFSRPPPSVC